MTLILVLIGVPFLFGLWAQMRVKSTFQQFAQVPSQGGHSGADVARLLLRARGLDVAVEKTGGYLSDHYDPKAKTLRLSEATYDSRSVAAIGVAAHEAGHALQDAESYGPLQFRSAIVPGIALGSRLLPILLMAAVFTGAFATKGLLAYLAVAAFAALAFFSLVTLPVEFDASKRALAVLEGGGILAGSELDGARKVLDAAALTYVAAFVSSIAQLLYWALHLFGGQRE